MNDDAKLPSYDELLAELHRRVLEIEDAHRQILALRLESSLRAAYVLELQNSLELAEARAHRIELEAIRTVRAQSLEAMEAFTQTDAEYTARAEFLRYEILKTSLSGLETEAEAPF